MPQYLNPGVYLEPYLRPLVQSAARYAPSFMANKRGRAREKEVKRQFDITQRYREAGQREDQRRYDAEAGTREQKLQELKNRNEAYAEAQKAWQKLNGPVIQSLLPKGLQVSPDAVLNLMRAGAMGKIPFPQGGEPESMITVPSPWQQGQTIQVPAAQAHHYMPPQPDTSNMVTIRAPDGSERSMPANAFSAYAKMVENRLVMEIEEADASGLPERANAARKAYSDFLGMPYAPFMDQGQEQNRMQLEQALSQDLATQQQAPQIAAQQYPPQLGMPPSSGMAGQFEGKFKNIHPLAQLLNVSPQEIAEKLLYRQELRPEVIEAEFQQKLMQEAVRGAFRPEEIAPRLQEAMKIWEQLKAEQAKPIGGNGQAGGGKGGWRQYLTP